MVQGRVLFLWHPCTQLSSHITAKAELGPDLDCDVRSMRAVNVKLSGEGVCKIRQMQT